MSAETFSGTVGGSCGRKEAMRSAGQTRTHQLLRTGVCASAGGQAVEDRASGVEKGERSRDERGSRKRKVPASKQLPPTSHARGLVLAAYAQEFRNFINSRIQCPREWTLSASPMHSPHPTSTGMEGNLWVQIMGPNEVAPIDMRLLNGESVTELKSRAKLRDKW
ncbi:hypothetical protein AXG93_2269s1190 [Marchantia polymorpha subsp. ruderalis]|uniref:Uncharacterized protein n=1 Tax=Marchantia polymorpha subsp. ruderalis TaxID=1480154 RepID=A0A176VIH4_MARPO|nr:hypothetical protein AXG93_2269s1190 [Marchantia polymorpha subsp. ruderalis]